MIAIVDYGSGNVAAIADIFKRLKVPHAVTADHDALRAADRYILPGVGAFDTTMRHFIDSGLVAVLNEQVTVLHKKVLGICVGMQILAHASEEGSRAGLGWVNGQVRSFGNNPASAGLPMPHMGWNDVAPVAGSPLFKGFENDARFYFLHSFYFSCTDAGDSIARSSYGFDFDCAVRSGNMFGVQFHPEKSHHWGTALLKNFAEL